VKTHESEMTCICFLLFFGIGTFQRVTADSNKNFFPVLLIPFPRPEA
jgi:hypothetical protein